MLKSHSSTPPLGMSRATLRLKTEISHGKHKIFGRDANEAGGSSSLADAGLVIEVHMFRLPAGST